MEHLDWGLEMTVLGMGLVFAMLALLWLILTIVLKFDKEEEVEETSVADDDAADDDAAEEAETATTAVSASDNGQTIDGMAADVLAAIMVAAMKHKLILWGEASPMVCTNWPGTQPSRWAAAGRVRQTSTWTPKG